MPFPAQPFDGMSLDWLCAPGAPLRGEIEIPGDKSISHRAIMLAAIADGVSRIHGFLEAEDPRATARIFGQLGVLIETPHLGERIVHGVGLHGLRASAEPLDCGNSGTGMRLLAGLLAGQDFESQLIGDSSLSRRPMARVVEPLRRMGARIEVDANGLPPIIIHSKKSLQSIDYKQEISSAQVKSALLLAGLYTKGETIIHEPRPTRDHTERLLSAMGYPIRFSPDVSRLSGGHRLRATDIAIPADFSSAAFFLVAASVIPGSDLLIRRVGINPRRVGLLLALRMMGADIREENASEQGGEPVADLRVRHARLCGIRVPESLVPDMIDEFPALFAAAAVAEGQTRISGAAELRVKESDRIAAMVQALRAIGGVIVESADGAVIEGGRLRGGVVDSQGDHRVAMSLAVAAQCASGEVRIADCANVVTSFPGFAESARSCGFSLALQKRPM